MAILSKPAYERLIASTRDERMKNWREWRFGMFIHFGLYSILGRHEWAMSVENRPIPEYEQLAQQFRPKAGAPREWAALAKKAGMKYMVMTTRHHEGFSLWDSKVNPYNAVACGGRDVVREFVDACREFDMGIGFYSSLMDWHHPDGYAAAYDPAANKRFNDYLTELNKELLTNYGKIDVLWYDVPAPMESHEGWNSLERNQILRELQPHLIINNRSRLDEDFGTPEEHIKAEDTKDWEACMTFNGLSWGYVDSEQARPYSYNAHGIIKMLNQVTSGGGNLLLNIGPQPDGSVPVEAIEPLTQVGEWLSKNGEAVYGKKDRKKNGGWTTLAGMSYCGNTAYIWNWIYPADKVLIAAGYESKLNKVRMLATGQELTFKQEGRRIFIDLPEINPSPLGTAVIAMDFESEPKAVFASAYPQLHGGEVIL